MTALQSKGVIAGISSVPTSQLFSLIIDVISWTTHNARKGSNVEEYIKLWSFGMSQYLLGPIAGQAKFQNAIRIQERKQVIVTKIPKSALWTLVGANLLFAIMGITLAILALLATSDRVHQVQTRLSIAGITAQICEKTLLIDVYRSHCSTL